MNRHQTRAALRREAAIDVAEYEHECIEAEREAEREAGPPPDTCCGCLICCCSYCDDAHRERRVREAREARRAAERKHERSRPWNQRGERAFLIAVFGLCRHCERPLSEAELDHEHYLCAQCSIDQAERDRACYYGCGRTAEPVTTRDGSRIPGAICDECLSWISLIDQGY